MTRFVVGLVAAIAAGAWVGFLSEWVSSSGGWDEQMHLGATAARSAAWFTAAFLVADAVRRRAGFGASLAVPTTCMLGAALFGSIAYMDDGRVEMEPGRVILLTVFSLPIMAGVVAIWMALGRLGRWLATSDLPGSPPRSLADR